MERTQISGLLFIEEYRNSIDLFLDNGRERSDVAILSEQAALALYTWLDQWLYEREAPGVACNL